LFAQLTELDRQERDERRAEEKAEWEAAEREERRFAEWFEAVEALADGAKLVFDAIRGRFSRLKPVWADALYKRVADWWPLVPGDGGTNDMIARRH
jgi:hypothetical protein